MRTTLLMMLLAMVGCIYADEVKVSSISMTPGESQTLSVELENATAMIAFEFWMRLPDGISIPKDEDGDYKVTKSSRLSKHDLAVARDADGRYHFLCYSNPIRNIKENSGELLNIELECDGNVSNGTYQATVDDLIFSDENKNRIDLPDSNFSITVSSTTHGDVNDDGVITIADVTALVNIILGKDDMVPYQYDHEAADVNGDHAVTIADVTALVNIILGKE